MKSLKITLFVIGFLVLSTQTLRHIYVKWIEPTDSVLDEFRPPVDDEIEHSKTIDELVTLYRKALDSVEKYEGDPKNRKIPIRERNHWEPYKTKRKISSSIRTWESQNKQIFELFFYWSCGVFAIIFGLLAYHRANKWLGIAGIIAGFAEMACWTSPLWRAFGPEEPFEQLLTIKLILSIISTVSLIVLWLWWGESSRRIRRKQESQT